MVIAKKRIKQQLGIKDIDLKDPILDTQIEE